MRKSVQVRTVASLLAIVLLSGTLAACRKRGEPEIAPVAAQTAVETKTVDPFEGTEKDRHIAIAAVRYTPGKSLGRYYVDLQGDTNGPVTLDEERMFQTAWAPHKTMIGSAMYPGAGTNAQDGLQWYSRFVVTRDDRFLARAKKVADWLISQQKPDGSWVYTVDFEEMKAPWISGLTQGVAISLLTRVYQSTGDEKYLTAAKRAFKPLTKRVGQGGVIDKFQDENWVLEEYPGSVRANRHVLNGAIFAIMGICDLGRLTGKREYNAYWWRLQKNLAANLPEYSINSWTAYSDPRASERKVPANLNYHRLHIAQARAMYALTSDGRWDQAARTWYQYLVNWHTNTGGRDFR